MKSRPHGEVMFALSQIPVPMVVFVFAKLPRSDRTHTDAALSRQLDCIVSPDARRLFGLVSEAEGAKHVRDMARASVDEHVPALLEQLADLLHSGEQRGRLEWATWRFDGELLELRVEAQIVHCEDEHVMAVLVLRDCQAERSSREGAELYRRLLEQSLSRGRPDARAEHD